MKYQAKVTEIGGMVQELAEDGNLLIIFNEDVQDPDLTVAKYVANAGSNIKINKIVRFETGEGLEKKEENFADEVASMIK